MTPHSRTFGKGARRALAIHCTMAHAGAWGGLGRAMADELTITAMDLPSHGSSPDWLPGTDQHRIATDMALSLLTEPMDVIGHSYGATVALRLGVEAPDRVRSLTLIEPVFFAAALADEPERVHAHDAELVDYEAARLRGDMEETARAFNRLWGDGTRWADFPPMTRRYMTDRVHFVSGSTPFVIDDYANLIGSRALEQLPMPVLLMQGETTPDVIDATHKAMARRIPRVRRVTIEGAGHMAPITHPETVAAEIRTLVQEV